TRDQRRPPPPVDRGDPADDRVLVLGTLLGARSRAPAVGAHAHVGLVPLARRAAHQPADVPIMDSQSPTKSGSVFATVPGSSMMVPGAASDMTAPAMTMRWSA